MPRGDFIKRAGVATAGFVAAGALFDGLLSPAAAAISSKPSKANDVKILNYALTLEYLEAELYAQAVGNNAFANAQLRDFANVVAQHEDAHVRLLRSVLGRAAVKKPTFEFGAAVTDSNTFALAAQTLEDTGVAAYAGQGPNISQRAIVKAALAIHSVEARHAAWIRLLRSESPAPRTSDSPKTEKSVLAAVKATGFVKG